MLLFCLMLGVFNDSQAEEKGISDTIKPALPDTGKSVVDPEQMRLVRATYKRIVERQKKERQAFQVYTEQMHSGVTFSMVPIAAKPFVWKGKKTDDVLHVTLDDFWMANTETSWEAYEAFYITELSREHDGSVNQYVRPSIKDDFKLLARPTVQDNSMSHGMPTKGHSAVSMTHHAANKFCQWLSYQTGHFYRLPTEAEWEYACRGGSQKRFSWGDEEKLADQYAWFAKDSNAPYHKQAQKKPNGFGLFDMHGNVLEITLDGFVEHRKKYFGQAKVHNPWVRATQPYPHVCKGGYWRQGLDQIVAGARTPTTNSWKKSDCLSPKSIWAFGEAPFLGFRVVRPVKIPTAEEMYYYWNSGTAYDGVMAVYE